VAQSLTITDRDSGVRLTPLTVPQALTLTPTAGSNEITVGWSAASGLTASEDIELRVQADETTDGQFRSITVDWGDSTPTEVLGEVGKSLDEYFVHTYISAGPFTITVTLKYRDSSVTDVILTLPITPNLSDDYLIDQVQIEKYQDEVRDHRPDWVNFDKVAASFLDVNVSRRFPYKYRIRFRTVDTVGTSGITSQFSTATTQGSWT
jgi:hypothetical protein